MEENEIIFRISRPYKVFKTLKAQKIVLPATKGMITILPSRAPIMIGLTNGLVEVLDDKNVVIDKMFIKGGLADVARNRCAVSSEKVVDYAKHDAVSAIRKRDEAVYQEDKDFYQFIADYFLSHV